VFLNANGFLVTNTRFEVPGQTFAMAGVTSVKVSKDVPSIFWPVILIVLGTTLTLIGLVNLDSASISVGCGLILLLIAGLWLLLKKTVYHLILTTAAGEQRATSSTNGKFMQSLRLALTNSIIHRG